MSGYDMLAMWPSPDVREHEVVRLDVRVQDAAVVQTGHHLQQL